MDSPIGTTFCSAPAGAYADCALPIELAAAARAAAEAHTGDFDETAPMSAGKELRVVGRCYWSWFSYAHTLELSVRAAAGAASAVLRLAETGAIPVAMTLMGLGTVPAGHPLNLGMLGMHASRATNLALEECDLLIAAGVRFDDRAVLGGHDHEVGGTESQRGGVRGYPRSRYSDDGARPIAIRSLRQADRGPS